MSFPYNPNVPNPPDNPSADVGDMHTNANSISTIMAVDHFGFNNNNGGKHQQVTMPSRGSAPATIAGSADLYVNTDSAGQQALWFVRDGFPLSNVQLTTSKILAPTVAANGCTFLPGGLLFQWGSLTINANPALTTILFPVAFPNAVYSIQTTRQQTSTGSTTAQEIFIETGSVALIGFQVATSSSAANNVCYWMAIGS
jgi:hypothetical protein